MPENSTLTRLRADLQAKQAEALRISNAFPTEGDKFAIPADMHRDFLTAARGAQEAKSMIDALEAVESNQRYLDEPEQKSVAGAHYGTPPQGEVRDGIEAKSLADIFIDSEAFRSAKEQRFEVPHIRAGVEGKSIYNFSGGTVTHQTLGSVDNVGIIEAQKRKNHIRDLFPKSSTRHNLIYGVRETGWVNNAKQIRQRTAADGVSPATGADTDLWGNAPKSKINLVPASWPAARIAHTIDAHKNILDDESRLRTLLNVRMVDGVKYAEDYDLLHSVGDGEKMTGLFNTPGVQTYTGLARDKYSVQVRRAVTRAMLAEYEPTGLVVSPTMWEQVETEEDDQGGFRVAISVAIGADKRVWRLNVVETTAMADATFVLGAFGMGAQIHDRETVHVSSSSEHASNFSQGLITMLAEERVAFEVSRPESFVIGTWTAPTVTP